MNEDELFEMIDWSCPWRHIDLCILTKQNREWFFGKEVDITPKQMEILLDFTEYRENNIKYIKIDVYAQDKNKTITSLQKNIERLNNVVRKGTRRKIIKNKRGKGYSLNVRGGILGVLIK